MPSVIKANMLEPLRSSIYAFKTDFVVAGWVARLKPNELDAARNELTNAGFPDPTIRNLAQRGDMMVMPWSVRNSRR